MAEGRWSEVAAPWGYRIGLPWMAAHLSRWATVSLPTALLLLAVASGAILIISLMFLLGGRSRVLPVLLATPVAVNLLHNYYLPDLMHAALVALFFVLLSVEWWIAAAALLFPMMLVRESTVPLTVILIVACWKPGWGTIAIVATLAGYLVSHLAVPHPANVHGMGEVLYLVLKVPVNAMRNLTGIVMIPSTMSGQIGYQCQPSLTLHLNLGRISNVGVCSPDALLPLTTLASMLTVFGTGPVMLWFHHEIPAQPWQKVAMLYGLVSFAIAPVLGAAVGRLAAYGWPLFWLYLAQRESPPSQWLLFMIASWLPFAIGLEGHPARSLCVVLLAAALYLLAAILHPGSRCVHTITRSNFVNS